MSKNLLFSLPDELMRYIFELDTTYRIFDDPKFELELQQEYLKLNSVRQQCIDEVTSYLETFFEDDCVWSNDYGYIDTFDTAKPNGYGYTAHKYYQSVNDFFVSLHQIEDVLYYKILPKEATPETCSFLRNPSKFDGYFLHTEFNQKKLSRIEDPCRQCYCDDMQVFDLVYDRDTRLAMYFN